VAGMILVCRFLGCVSLGCIFGSSIDLSKLDVRIAGEFDSEAFPPVLLVMIYFT